MAIGPVVLDPLDAVECSELLDFVGRWLASEDDELVASLNCCVGGDGYDINELRADLSRFAELLGGER